jgi:hypothetical protein
LLNFLKINTITWSRFTTCARKLLLNILQLRLMASQLAASLSVITMFAACTVWCNSV